ncbi:hypothetical protein BCV70DRAFT_117158 [Testicularia cyperi]|uniref:Uncharacterized protein n=1 Tax=Testicularia cyperi TaxID=1882483 RepID=A0A317XMP9_9BASI|nr:hypothetical protein BCV70DRAFT_117158 [Testicularia cyperi]
MSQQVQQSLKSAGMEEDSAYFVGRYGVSGVQIGCLAATPLYLVSVMRGRGFSLRGLARYNWLVPVGGGAVGSLVGYLHSSGSAADQVSAKVNSLRLDAERVRQDDLHLIGSVLGALVLPAIFLRRTGLINGLLGGAGLGGAAGVITHHVQKLSSGSAQKDLNKLENKSKDLASDAKSSLQDVKDKASSVFNDAKAEANKRL